MAALDMAFAGFGEAQEALATGLREARLPIAARDILHDDPVRRDDGLQALR